MEVFAEAERLDHHGIAATLEVGKLLRAQGRPEEAQACFERALKRAPRSAAAWNGLGAAYIDLKDFVVAERCFRKALAIHPGLSVAEANLAATLRAFADQMHVAAGHGDWKLHSLYSQSVLAAHRVRRHQGLSGLIRPFNVLGFELSAEEQRDAAESMAAEYLAEEAIKIPQRPPIPEDLDGRRLRVGYLSADIRNNAAAHLTHRLFEIQDRDRFEVFVYSMGVDDGSFYRQHVETHAEHFLDVMDEAPEATAARIRSDGIDVLVDMMGFAGNHRAAICARRPAPVQMFWLGYCCTTGAPWIDYFVTDKIVTPPGHESHFSEALAYLPDCYQMYSGEDFSEHETTRAEQCLPEDAFVYCCFNLVDKIDPPIFARWMAILKQTENTLLWLMAAGHDTETRLAAGAKKHGVDPARIIYAPLLSKRDHLARVALADLFLDTTRFGAHTTASDALWAGVPVLTCPGELFAQRVAASVCRAAGLPDLIVNDMDAYTQLAVELGQDRERTNALKAKLLAARATAPLFDTERFTRNFEDLLQGLARREV